MIRIQSWKQAKFGAEESGKVSLKLHVYTPKRWLQPRREEVKIWKAVAVFARVIILPDIEIQRKGKASSGGIWQSG